MTNKRLICILLGLFVGVLELPILTVAQDTPPAPQFLYRSNNHLILMDGYTGKTSTLPIEVTEKDYFAWSPDGQYLAARLYQGENNDYCLNLYDVDKQKWTNEKPISCTVQEAIYSSDSSQIFYATSDKSNAILWKYTLSEKISHEVYRTTNGNESYPSGVTHLKWSPTRRYLTFEAYNWITSGTLNSFIVLDVESGKYVSLNAPASYAASYDPIWSGDDRWFLIILQEEYAYTSAILITNHQGDIYLFNSDTGKEYRITYTPNEREVNVRWTDEGKIAFSLFTEQKLTFTLKEAMNVKVVPYDEIVQPDDIDAQDYFDSIQQQGVIISTDPNLGAWTTHTQQEPNKDVFMLNIGALNSGWPTSDFSVPISDPNQSGTVLIGWRPSNYPYTKE